MDKATLIFVTQNNRFDNLKDQLTDYALVTIDEPGNYMNTLIETRSAMILINGEHPEWESFTTAPTTSPATRRIPIVVVTDDDDQRAKASVIGADLTFSFADINKQIIKIVDDYGRIPDPERTKQLDCECDEPLPQLAIEGVKKFNAGEYYPQHDLFEEQWMETDGPVRDLYRAVLQVGVAYYQIERGNYRGALKMLQRSVQWLSVLPDVCQTINVAQLRDDSYAVRAELERLGEDRLDEFDRSLLKPVVRVESD